MRVPHDQRTPGPDVIDVRPALRVNDPAALTPLDEDRIAAYGAPGANRTVDASRDDGLGEGKKLNRRRHRTVRTQMGLLTSNAPSVKQKKTPVNSATSRRAEIVACIEGEKPADDNGHL